MNRLNKLLFFILIFSCSLHRHSANENQNLSKEQVKQDLKVLHYALRKSYSGQYFAPGINMKEFFRQLRKVPKRATRKKLLGRLQSLLATLPDGSIKALDYIQEDDQLTLPPWKFEDVNLEGEKGVLLKVIQFTSLNSPYWDQFQEKLKQNMSKSNFLVLDLRNSIGDDDSVGIFIARYFNGGVLRHPVIRQHHIRTKESLRLLKNYWSLKRPNQKFPFPEYRKGEAKILPIEFRRDDVAYSKKYAPDKRLYLLVDESCEKPCETTLYALEKNPHVSIIGEKTKGAIHFGHPGLLVLPNSNISVLIPTSYNEFADGRFEEKRGFKPKKSCSPELKSDDKLLKHICEKYW